VSPSQNHGRRHGDPPGLFHEILQNLLHFFNYGNRLLYGYQQTKLSNILKPTATIFLAEQDPTTATAVSESVTNGKFPAARHGNNKLENFAMCDGSCRSARTNEFLRNQSDYYDAGKEWAIPRTMYWYPSPSTQN
jgi:hypothetical protein